MSYGWSAGPPLHSQVSTDLEFVDPFIRLVHGVFKFSHQLTLINIMISCRSSRNVWRGQKVGRGRHRVIGVERVNWQATPRIELVRIQVWVLISELRKIRRREHVALLLLLQTTQSTIQHGS